jgi:hypothetical protein
VRDERLELTVQAGPKLDLELVSQDGHRRAAQMFAGLGVVSLGEADRARDEWVNGQRLVGGRLVGERAQFCLPASANAPAARLALIERVSFGEDAVDEGRRDRIAGQ